MYESSSSHGSIQKARSCMHVMIFHVESFMYSQPPET